MSQRAVLVSLVELFQSPASAQMVPERRTFCCPPLASARGSVGVEKSFNEDGLISSCFSFLLCSRQGERLIAVVAVATAAIRAAQGREICQVVTALQRSGSQNNASLLWTSLDF